MLMVYVAEGFSPPRAAWKAKALRYVARSVGGLIALLAAVMPIAGGASAAPPEPVIVRASVDRDHVTVGDRIALTIVVEHDDGLTPAAPDATSAFGPFEVLAAEPPRVRSLGGGRTETAFVFTVAAFGTGSLEVPPVTSAYEDAGTPATVNTPAIPVTVSSVIPAGESPTDVRDLKPQLDVPGGVPAYLTPTLIVVAAAAVAGLTTLLALAVRRRRQRPAPSPPVTLPAPEDEARAELERIAGLGLPDGGDHKEHYRLLGGCVRRYLAGRYGFPALALTTAELGGQMVGLGVDRWQARLVSSLLQECDDVRYGQYVPAAARADADLTAAFEIVEMTRPASPENSKVETLEVGP